MVQLTGLRWGLVGASDIASQSLVPGIRAQPDSAVVAVSSRSAERGAQFAARCGLDRSCRLEEMLASPDIDAVYISTTNDLHAEHTIAAARAGKHVLCEKPLATSMADADAMVTECRHAGVVLAVNHGRRHKTAIRAARDIVRAGQLGTVVAARTSNAVLLPQRLRRWRLANHAAGGGAVLDLVVHEADTLRFVLDDEPVEVAATAASDPRVAASVEDLVIGDITMASGLLAAFFCAFTTPAGAVGLELHGTEASFVADHSDPDPQAWLRHADRREPIVLGEPEPVAVATVRAFEAAIRGDGTPTATGEDGVRALAVALAALESASTGRRVRL